MTRKDSEKDSDRPHYYSQFWLDIAAGRRTIGGPHPADADEPLDDEPPAQSAPIASTSPTSSVAPTTSRRASRNGQEHSSAFDGLQEQADEYETRTQAPAASAARSTVEPLAVQDEIGEPEAEQEPDISDFATDDIGDLDLQEAAVEDSDIPDVDFDSLEDEEEDEEFYDEDEEDDDWTGGRGRKKGKPGRTTKPTPKRNTRRDSRRTGY